ncbi:MAG: amidohydrolase [Desulfobacterales bacterium]|nr:amidohydrolase [Desulfobacterales bacterium]
MTQDIAKKADALKEKLSTWRRDFHRHAESGWTEFRTSAIIAKHLQSLGYTLSLGKDIICQKSMMGVPSHEVLAGHMNRAVEEGADPDFVSKMEGGLTGVVAELCCGKGPLMILRFDIDANDIMEAQDEGHRPFRDGFASIHPRVMHACGHDGHAAIGLGVAELLASLKDHIKGTVRLVFQPAEEGVRGAGPMVDAGVMKGADCILGGHIGFQAKEKGQVICGSRGFLATTKFDARFTGTPAHAGGFPEEGSNALLAAASAALNLHAITRHSKGASRITVGTMEAGQGRNIIPPNALLKVETRGETSEIDAFMFENAKNVIEGSALMYGVDAQLTLMGQTKGAESDPEMVAQVEKAARKTPYFEESKISGIADMRGSEDFSHMMSVVQKNGGIGAYFMVGTELSAGHHDFYFDFDEGCLAPAVALFTQCTLSLLS